MALRQLRWRRCALRHAWYHWHGTHYQAIARRSFGFDMQELHQNRSQLSPNLEVCANHSRYVNKEELLQKTDPMILVLQSCVTTKFSSRARRVRERTSAASGFSGCVECGVDAAYYQCIGADAAGHGELFRE